MSRNFIRDKTDSLRKIAEEIASCRLCLKWGTGRPVPGEGNPDAFIVFIGEAPGRKEAETGRPFIGRSGRFLREALSDMGIQEEDVFITSPVKYLPVKGTPSRENVEHGRSHLLKQLAVIDPGIIVLMGGVACLGVLGENIRVSKEHGQVIERDGRKCLITFHPAYAARFPEGRKVFLQDLKKLKSLISA